MEIQKYMKYILTCLLNPHTIGASQAELNDENVNYSLN